MNATNNSLSSSKDACFHWHVIINDEYVVSDYFYTVLAIVINLLTCPFIILLNGLVIVAIKTKRRLQTPHNILLACLAATDLVVGIGAQPVFITEEIYVLVAGTSSLACSFYNLTQLVIMCFCYLSVMHLAIISIERFVALKYSLRYEIMVTKFRISVAVGCCWLIATFNAISKIFKIRILVSFIILVVSFLLIIFCHTYVYFVCRRHEIQIKSEQISQEATAKFLKEKKAWKTTSIIIGCFFVCYFPGFVTGILPAIFPGFLIRRLLVSSRPLIFSLYILNSLCNPIIYCWRSKEIREVTMQLLRKLANGGLN